MWRAVDVGRPLPDDPHAVSVCLPTWGHVIAYEEGDRDLIDRFFTGYPRFCCHRYQQRLFEAAAPLAGHGERALVFPSIASARRCAGFLLKNNVPGARACDWPDAGLAVALFPAEAYATARLYWRFSGEVIGSRRAAAILGGLRGSEEGGIIDGGGGLVSSGEGARARDLVRGRLADLAEQTADCVFLFPSGMAAIAAVQRVLTALRPGLPTLQVDFPYVDVLKVQQHFGAGAEFNLWRDASEERELFERIDRGSLAAIYAEVPSNPLLRCVDLPRLHGAAVAAGVPLVVDDTVGTPVNLRAQAYADVVTSSLTKYFSGAGNVMAGCAIVSAAGPFARVLCEGLAEAEAEAGGLADADAVVLELNSRDFPRRMARINRTTEALVGHLRQHPGLAVHFPDLSHGSNYRRLMRAPGAGVGEMEPGGGGLFSMVLESEEAAVAFFDALRVSKGPSLGTNFTLACPYTLLAHYDELEWAAGCGVASHLVRVSVGLEDADDLCQRFDEALRA